MNTREQNIKKNYVAPSIEIIKMENEGVIAASGEGYTPIEPKYGAKRTYGTAASSNEIEDFLNDILTIEN